jgi:arylsulfatase A-like enzyme
LSKRWQAPIPVCVLALVCTGCVSFSAERPNVLFLLTDDQRADTISALGNPHIQTPHLDGLARKGFVFTRAYLMGSQLPAVCIPSRAMLLTGRGLFAATHPRKLAEIPPTYRTWPEVFRRAGYKTIGIGKWHNDKASYARAFSAGGPIFFGGMTTHTNVRLHSYDPTGNYSAANSYFTPRFSSTVFADAAIAQIRANRSRPFAMYVAFTAPHDPRMAPAAYAARYSADNLAVPANFMPQHPFDNGEMDVRDEMLLPWPRTPEAIKGELAAYYAMISHLDAQIGRILNTLRDTGLARKTIVVFAADNGLALGSHGLLGKQNLYEHSMRVPLIFSGAGIPIGRSSALAYLYDVYPTLCKMTGLRVPATVQGRNLLPIITGQRSVHRESIFCAYRNVQRMVCNQQWKLIAYPEINRIQLFDLANDPDELTDLSASPEHQGPLIALKERLIALQHKAGDPLLLP